MSDDLNRMLRLIAVAANFTCSVGANLKLSWVVIVGPRLS